MKRAIDICLAGTFLIVSILPMACIAMLIRLTSKGPALHWSKRIGRDNQIFRMPKFRTMRIDTPQLATHKLDNADLWMVPGGRLLRTTSLDELPQLWSVLVGDMTLVGPRPALFNQDDLVAARTRVGVHRLVPGVTGWAQVNGRDELSIPEKVEYDRHYATHQTHALDLRIMLMTAVRVFHKDGIAQAGEESRGLEPSSERRAA